MRKSYSLVILNKIFNIYSSTTLSHLQGDESYLRMKYFVRFGKKINLEEPQTYNEKLQWLKLHDRRDLYTIMVDKYSAKEYVADLVGSEYIIPTLGVWNRFDDIDFQSLPEQFVLKTTHDSGGVVICKNKKEFDFDKAQKILNKSLKNNYYWSGREWPYKMVKPRIIAEKYMVDESGYELKDYKFFCFDGVPKALFVASDRQTPGEDTKFDFFDMDFNHLPFTNGHPNAKFPPKKPKAFEEMKMIASKLSVGIPQVRVDLYDINGKVYFGELTLSHWDGFVPFEPPEWDKTFGDWVVLPKEG